MSELDNIESYITGQSLAIDGGYYSELIETLLSRT
ncbi:SDR family oxidoreductase [Atlanticothrix silvestris]|nr:SDR family oxidoreductase [Atlanticothrix silvestris]